MYTQPVVLNKMCLFFSVDVSIQTNSADKSKIFLRAGQKVIVLKSPRGICLQLESGKVIAIRASMKGQSGTSSIGSLINDDDKLSNFNGNDQSMDKIVAPAANESDIIDMTNDEDDDDVLKVETSKTFLPVTIKCENSTKSSAYSEKKDEIKAPLSKETFFKEKPAYKPNLVSRKQKLQSNTPTENVSCPQQNNLHSKTTWNNYAYRDTNGNSKSESVPFRSCKFIFGIFKNFSFFTFDISLFCPVGK
jgi:hypothetical protein